MSKIVYLSYEPSEGVMTSMGMIVRKIERKTDFFMLLKQLKKQQVSLVYVSEAVYQAEKETIRQYNKEFSLTITILPNQLHHRSLGQKRMNKMIEEAIGIKVD